VLSDDLIFLYRTSAIKTVVTVGLKDSCGVRRGDLKQIGIPGLMYWVTGILYLIDITH
jgi:hypothetical protein